MSNFSLTRSKRQQIKNYMGKILEELKESQADEIYEDHTKPSRIWESQTPELDEVALDIEPMKFRERLVFRSNQELPEMQLLHLHQSYKKTESIANKYLAVHSDLNVKNDQWSTMPLKNQLSLLDRQILHRCAVRSYFEE